MNWCVFVIISVLLVRGGTNGVSLCPAGHVMDRESRSCWKLSSVFLDIKECKTTLPELQAGVQGMLNALEDIERHMRQLEKEQNARFSVISEPNQITDYRKQSRESQSEKNPTNHVLEFPEQRELNEQHVDLSKSERTPRDLSLAAILLEGEQNTQTFEFSDQNELDEQGPIAQSPKKEDQIGEEQSTPVFEFSELNEQVTTRRKDKESSANKSLKKQYIHSSEFSEQDTPNKVQVYTEDRSSAHDSKEDPDTFLLSSPEQRRIGQLENDIDLQKEINEKCAAEVRGLVDSVYHLQEENEHVRMELMSLQDSEREHIKLISDQNDLLSEHTEVLERAHFLTEQCEATMDQVEGKMNMMEEELNDQIAQRDELIKLQLILIEKKDDELVRQKRIIKYLRGEMSRLSTIDQPIRYDDSSETDELLSSMDMMEGK